MSPQPTIRELLETPMPPAIAALPRDERGYPIPFFVAILDGKPDLKILDQRKQSICAHLRLCGICGGRLADRIAFVSGPLGLQNRISSDPGMHEDCARYAMRVCPYLARPSAQRAKKHHPSTRTQPGAVQERPERMVLYIVADYRIVSPDGGRSLLFETGEPCWQEWFGEEAPRG